MARPTLEVPPQNYRAQLAALIKGMEAQSDMPNHFVEAIANYKQGQAEKAKRNTMDLMFQGQNATDPHRALAAIQQAHKEGKRVDPGAYIEQLSPEGLYGGQVQLSGSRLDNAAQQLENKYIPEKYAIERRKTDAEIGRNEILNRGTEAEIERKQFLTDKERKELRSEETYKKRLADANYILGEYIPNNISTEEQPAAIAWAKKEFKDVYQDTQFNQEILEENKKGREIEKGLETSAPMQKLRLMDKLSGGKSAEDGPPVAGGRLMPVSDYGPYSDLDRGARIARVGSDGLLKIVPGGTLEPPQTEAQMRNFVDGMMPDFMRKKLSLDKGTNMFGLTKGESKTLVPLKDMPDKYKDVHNAISKLLTVYTPETVRSKAVELFNKFRGEDIEDIVEQLDKEYTTINSLLGKPNE
jgi:hypothetical protein